LTELRDVLLGLDDRVSTHVLLFIVFLTLSLIIGVEHDIESNNSQCHACNNNQKEEAV
jgi:hypothetical protein